MSDIPLAEKKIGLPFGIGNIVSTGLMPYLFVVGISTGIPRMGITFL